MLEDINCLFKRKHQKDALFRLFLSLFIFFLTIQLNAQETADTTTTDAVASTVEAAPDDGITMDPEIIDAGETLFNNYCKVCHAVDKQVIGPALAGVYERHDLQWLITFIQNSQRVIESGDEYAVQLYEQYNQTVMPSHDLSDDEVVAILAYVKDQTLNPPAAQVAVADDSGVTGTAPSGLSISSGVLIAIMTTLIIVLVLILVVLVLLVQTLTRFMKQKKGLDESELEVVTQRFNIMNLVRHPSFVGFASFIFVAIMLKSVIDGLYSIGIQQDYAPTQPIAYSHKVHAGEYAIECEYCHTGAAVSKQATIPPASTCMNCHSAIVKVTGEDEPSEEIQKIYDAIENNRPIEWVRVHNLPDLAYFNHAQHYKVGNIECQDCHGPIETMEVVKQHSTLTMGWCIDCHRETVVQTDNGYYDQLVELHKTVSEEDMVVADIGGLECSKCHY
jgi:mono/diheme cytochrome c family protein